MRSAAELLALSLGPPQAGTYTFLNHCSLELRKDAHHLEHSLAGWRGGVEPLLMQEQVYTERVQLGQEADEVLQAASEAIDRPRHHDVELPFDRVPA
jgi:hypothetical protein